MISRHWGSTAAASSLRAESESFAVKTQSRKNIGVYDVNLGEKLNCNRENVEIYDVKSWRKALNGENIDVDEVKFDENCI